MHAMEMRHWWFRGRRVLLVDLVRAAARGVARPRILDLGSGTGGNASAYSQLGRVVGAEPDAGAVALARTRGGADYCRASGTELPFKDASFDVVVASDVLEHIGDDAAAVREVRRVLRPGAAFVFTVPAHPWLFTSHDVALAHFRRYTRPGLLDLLRRGGLPPERLSYWNCTLFPAVSAARVLSTLAPAREPRSDVHATPAFVDGMLTRVLAAEAWALRRVNLPWGVSLAGIARRD